MKEEKREQEITGAGQWTEEAKSDEIARDSRKNSRGRKVGEVGIEVVFIEGSNEFGPLDMKAIHRLGEIGTERSHHRNTCKSSLR